MQEAITEATLALRAQGEVGELLPDDVPIGAVILNDAGEIIGRGHNQRELTGDPTAHAEVLAIREAAQEVGEWRLENCTLVVTLEPCIMCAGAIVLARIPRIVIGAWDDKGGATGSVWDLVRDPAVNHFTEVISGVRQHECAALLTDFFKAQRAQS